MFFFVRLVFLQNIWLEFEFVLGAASSSRGRGVRDNDINVSLIMIR